MSLLNILLVTGLILIGTGRLSRLLLLAEFCTSCRTVAQDVPDIRCQGLSLLRLFSFHSNSGQWIGKTRQLCFPSGPFRTLRPLPTNLPASCTKEKNSGASFKWNIMLKSII
jgi:hypothetical protein